MFSLHDLTEDQLVILMHELTLELGRRDGNAIEEALERNGIPCTVRHKKEKVS